MVLKSTCSLTLEEVGGMARHASTGGEEIEFSRRVREAQGVITWDVPARLDGTLDPEFLPALRAIGAALTP